jgi:uncharacterized protein DUF1761
VLATPALQRVARWPERRGLTEEAASSFDLAGINWPAVLIATVLYFALGALWFAPQTPLGRAWVRAAGYESPTGGVASTNAFYVVPAATSLLMVIATAWLAGATATDTLGEGVVLGLIVGVGYALPLLMTTAAFEFRKPQQWTWGVIDASYHVVGLVLAAVIIGVFG